MKKIEMILQYIQKDCMEIIDFIKGFEEKGRMLPKAPNGIKHPVNANELCLALESLIPERDRQRLRVVVVDISG